MPMQGHFTETLARHIALTKSVAIAPAARQASARILADSVGVTVGGARSDLAEPLSRYLAPHWGKGSCRVLGSRQRTTPEMAALANGAFGAALDFDDVFSSMPAHPSVLVLAVALACAGERRVSGADLMDAHVIGLEVGDRMGKLLTLQHYNQGFHATGTLGIFSAVAALARLQRLTPKQVQTALGLACSMASGLQCNFGTMAKPLLSGLAARSAVQAVRLAVCGLSAADDAIEGKAGFLAAFGSAEHGPDRLDNWGHSWAICEPGVSLRKFACYNANQRAMQAILELRALLDFDATTLDRLACRMPLGGMQGAIHPIPTTGLQAKFSLQYALAAGVLDGRFGLDTFSDAAVSRPEIASLLQRIDAHESEACRGDDPDFEKRTPGARGFVEVQAWTRDGRSASVRVDIPPGHPRRPLNWDELRDKFIDCARHGGVTSDKAATVFARLQDLENCADLEAALAPLQPDE